MKKLILIAILAITPLTMRAQEPIVTISIEDVPIKCNVEKFAKRYLAQITDKLKTPKVPLLVSKDPLRTIDIKKYGKDGQASVGGSWDGTRIIVYRKAIELYDCPIQKQELKRVIVHEYTHYLDTKYDLIGEDSKNLEIIAILGEWALPKAVWNKNLPHHTRNLSLEERKIIPRLTRQLKNLKIKK